MITTPALKQKMDRIVTRLLKTQEPDGYLGTYPKEQRWTGWDVWCHKYDLLGLLAYYQFTTLANKGKPTVLGIQAFDACRRIGDLLCATFGTEPGKRDINRAGSHVGMAPDSVLEPMVLLYRASGHPRYLAFAEYIVKNYDAPRGPALLASLEKTHSVRKVANAKAYEMLSNFNGILELYRVTGNRRYLDAMRIAWQDIVDNRLYITGGTSSFETFQDNEHLPNGMDSHICETCVTVTWEQMNLQLLRLTGEAKYADEIEKSVYNHLLAAQKPTGEDWAYYTPLEGHKPYDAVTTCCHSSGPRGIALLPEAAYQKTNDGGIAVNLYNSGSLTTRLKSGVITITQRTNYPASGTVFFTIKPQKNWQSFPLRLRLPAWARGYTLKKGLGELVPSTGVSVASGYIVLDFAWQKDVNLIVSFDTRARVVLGSGENAGKGAIMQGPLVLALDTAANPDSGPLKQISLFSRPEEIVRELNLGDSTRDNRLRFNTVMSRKGVSGPSMTLVPFADAGADGRSQFEVWIPLVFSPNAAPESLFSGTRWGLTRKGNLMGDINDDDFSTFAVTFDKTKSEEDWFAVTRPTAVTIDRVVFAHGKTFHDGGWFDTDGGRSKPQIQVMTEAGGAWKTIAALDAYPATTETNAAGLKAGQKFDVKFAPVSVFGVRIMGRPACGDNPEQNFASCAELQAFHDAK